MIYLVCRAEEKTARYTFTSDQNKTDKTVLNFRKGIDKCYILLYTVYRTGGNKKMKILINNSSMQPIYEQITDQIKSMIISGELKEHDICLLYTSRCV